MTVPTSSTRGQVAGDGSNTLFNLDFQIPERHVPNLELTHVNTSADEAVLILNTDYSVNYVNSQFTFPLEGSTYSTLASGEKIVYRLKPPLTQGVDLVNQQGFYAETIEEALDDARFVDQLLQEQLDRCVKVSVGSSTNPEDLLDSAAAAAASAAAAAASAAAAAAFYDAYIYADDYDTIQLGLAAVKAASGGKKAFLCNPGKTYLVDDNVLLPDTAGVTILMNRCTWRLNSAPVDSNYFVASEKYAGNTATAQNSMAIFGGTIDANDLADHACVWQSWNSDIMDMTFQNGLAGDGLRTTTETRNGTSFASGQTLVNNRIWNCRMTSNGGNGYYSYDPGARDQNTDWQLWGCYLYGNGGYGIRTSGTAGCDIMGNHTYSNTSGGCYIDYAGRGMRFRDNYFEETANSLRVNDGEGLVRIESNTFFGLVNVIFASTTYVLVSDGNNYFGSSARLNHDYFSSASRVIYSINDTFSDGVTQPYTWSNGSSTSPIIARDSVWKTGTAMKIMQGMQRTLSSTFTPSTEEYASAVPSSGTYTAGQRVLTTVTGTSTPLGWKCTTGGTFGGTDPIFWKFGELHKDAEFTWDVGSLTDGTGETYGSTVTVTGAAFGDFVDVGCSIDTQGIRLIGWVSAANTVKVRAENETGGTIDLASATFYVRVRKRTA